MNADEFWDHVRKYGSVETCEGGQIVIYTDLMFDDDDAIVPFED